MTETNKEYKYRVFINDLIEYIKSLTDNEGLCDCSAIIDADTKDTHEEDCISIQVLLDVVRFDKKLTELKRGES